MTAARAAFPVWRPAANVAVSHLEQRYRAFAAALPTEGGYAIRIVSAAAVSWQLCVWLGASQPPIYALIVPIVAMRDAPDSAFSVSIGRVIGVVAGLSLGIAVLSVVHPGVPSVALVLALALVTGIALRVGGSLNTQVAVSALLVFANSDPASYAESRLWETCVGAGVTILLSLIMKPTNPVLSLESELREVVDHCANNVLLAAEATRILSASDSPGEIPPPADEILQRLWARTRSTETSAQALLPRLAAARNTIRVHPLWRKRYTRELAALTPTARIVADAASLIRLYADEITDLAERPDTQDWATSAGPAISSIPTHLSEAAALRLSGQLPRAPLADARSALTLDTNNDDTLLAAIALGPLQRIITLLTE